MDLQQLRRFVAIVDNGGVSRAAARLNMSQPAATRQIQVLEAGLGVPLFDRIGRRVQLTAEGEDLLRRCRTIIKDVELLQERAQSLRDGEAGVIAIGATPPMIESVLVDFLAGYRKQFPRVDVGIIEDGGAGLISRLEKGEVHLAYIPADGDRWVGRLLYPVHVIAVLARTHPLAADGALEVTALAGEPLLLLRQGFGSRAWFDQACDSAKFHGNVSFQSSSHNALIGLASAGFGIAILPSAVNLPATVRAMPLVLRRKPLGKWTMLAWDPNRFMPRYALAFADALASHAEKVPPGHELIRTAPSLPKPNYLRDGQ
jgi:LysR family transcriptional regulator, cyn operon transcriptional activator